jgi:hypothetical protein
VKVEIGRNELNEESSEDFSKTENDEDNHEEGSNKNGSLENKTGVKWEFYDATWKNPNFMYEPML